MSIRKWFLPETPDVLGMLGAQMEVTVEGMEALVAWAAGDGDASDRIRDCEHRADDHKRELRSALRQAFTTPIDAEDLYALSERLDAALNQAKDAVREAEVMAMEPDQAERDMSELICESTRHLQEAFAGLAEADGGLAGGSGPVPRAATECADAAVKCQRNLERVYRSSMSALIDEEDLREVMGRRELYRRFSRVGDTLVDVAERVWYAVVKEG